MSTPLPAKPSPEVTSMPAAEFSEFSYGYAVVRQAVDLPLYDDI